MNETEIVALEQSSLDQANVLCIDCFRSATNYACVGQGYVLQRTRDKTCLAIGFLHDHCLYCICVKNGKMFRRKGYAMKMVNHLLQLHTILHPNRAVHLKSQNKASDKLYYKCKFEKVKRYWGHNYFAWIPRSGTLSSAPNPRIERAANAKTVTVEQLLKHCLNGTPISFQSIIDRTNLAKQYLSKMLWFNHYRIVCDDAAVHDIMLQVPRDQYYLLLCKTNDTGNFTLLSNTGNGVKKINP